MAATDGLTHSELLDLIETTKEKYPLPEKFTVTQEYNRYVVINQWLQRMKEMPGGGERIKMPIQLKTLGSAQMTRLYAGSNIFVGDVMDTVEVLWYHLIGQWSIDKREIHMNESVPEQIASLMEVRRTTAMQDIADLIERRAWLSPDSGTDDLNVRGIPYWIVPLADGQAGEGFYGAQDSNFSNCGTIVGATGGINTTSPTGGEPRWRNYAAGGTNFYVNMDVEAVDTMKKMALKINWVAPFIVKKTAPTSMDMLGIYMNTDTMIDYERLAVAQNDQLGPDVARFAEGSMFRGRPIIYSDQLDTDTRNPVYMLNHNDMHFFVLQGSNMVEDEALRSRENPNVLTTFVNFSWSIGFQNRRTSGVMRKTA